MTVEGKTALADARAQVFVHYGINAAAAEEVVNEIRAKGGSAEVIVPE